jgi:predicted ATPase
MLQRRYIHNFRCLENFELNLKDAPSTLLIGKNGVGKSSIAYALILLQRLGRGDNKVGDLIKPGEITQGRSNVPVRFELDVLLNTKNIQYTLVLELPAKFREFRVLEEKLVIDDEIIYSRAGAIVTLYAHRTHVLASFSMDWHMVALSIIQAQADANPADFFKTWLAQMVILAPVPCLMSGDSSGEDSLLPERDGANFGEWFSSLLSQYPAAYSTMADHLRQIMPDFRAIKNPLVGKDAKSIQVQFTNGNTRFEIAFGALSDGEKCFFLCAVVLAANEHYGPIFCFWDEPDNYLGIAEVGHFIVGLRRSVLNKGQLLMTSHNGEAMRKFAKENILVTVQPQ